MPAARAVLPPHLVGDTSYRLDFAIQMAERKALMRALAAVNGQQTLAAQLLGCSRATVSQLRKRYAMEPERPFVVRGPDRRQPPERID